MKNKNIILSILIALLSLLGGCSASPLLFDGKQVVYQTDPVMTRKRVIGEDAAKRCASVNKKAVYMRRTCVPGGDCTTYYKCE